MLKTIAAEGANSPLCRKSEMFELPQPTVSSIEGGREVINSSAKYYKCLTD